MGRTSSQNFWRGINLDVTSISVVVVEESEGHSLNPGEFHEASLRMTHSGTETLWHKCFKQPRAVPIARCSRAA